MLDETRAQGILSALRGEIETGKYREGDRVPSERELAEIYHVSRDTVRKALQVLETAGEIERRGASGTYVTSRQMQNLIVHGSATPSSHSTGKTTEGSLSAEPAQSQVIIEGKDESSYIEQLRGPVALIPASDWIAEELGVQRHSLVIRRQAMLTDAEGRRLEIIESFYPVDLSVRTNLADIALNDWLARPDEKDVERVTEDLKVRLPQPEEREFLKISQLSPVVQVQRKAQDHCDRVLELTVMVIPAAVARFRYEYRPDPRGNKNA